MTLASMSEHLQMFFTTNATTEAWATQFVRRRSKMTGAHFLQVVVFGWLDNAHASLTDLAAFAHDCLGFEVTAQGGHDRIHKATLVFLRAMFKLALRLFYDTVRVPLAVFTPFPAVYLIDSTAISLPASLATWFPGSGGDASPAGLKLQVVFEFLTGIFSACGSPRGHCPIRTSRNISRWLNPAHSPCLI